VPLQRATRPRASERFFIAVVPEPYSASFNRTSLESITVNSHGYGIGTNNKCKPLFIEILNTSKSATITVELHHLFYFYIIFKFILIYCNFCIFSAFLIYGNLIHF